MSISFFQAAKELLNTVMRHLEEDTAKNNKKNLADRLAVRLHLSSNSEAVSELFLEISQNIGEGTILPTEDLAKAVLEKFSSASTPNEATAIAINIYKTNPSTFDWFFSKGLKLSKKSQNKMKYYPAIYHDFLEQITTYILQAERTDHAKAVLNEIPQLKKLDTITSREPYLPTYETKISETANKIAKELTDIHSDLITGALIECMAFQVAAHKGHPASAETTLLSMLQREPDHLSHALAGTLDALHALNKTCEQDLKKDGFINTSLEKSYDHIYHAIEKLVDFMIADKNNSQKFTTCSELYIKQSGYPRHIYNTLQDLEERFVMFGKENATNYKTKSDSLIKKLTQEFPFDVETAKLQRGHNRLPSWIKHLEYM